MKTKRFLKCTLFVLLAGLVFVSCNDDEIAFEVYADVLVINKKVGDAVKKAPAYYAYGNKSLKSASVTLPGNSESTPLGISPGSTYTFMKEPAAADFKVGPPAEGNYRFKASAGSGEELEMTDAFAYTGLPLPQITKDTFSNSTESLFVQWAAVTGSDGYFVKLLDTDENQVFSGYVVSSMIYKYTISGTQSSGVWSETPKDGETYILQVNAVIYDADATSSNKDYNVSEISVSEKQIKWGVK